MKITVTRYPAIRSDGTPTVVTARTTLLDVPVRGDDGWPHREGDTTLATGRCEALTWRAKGVYEIAGPSPAAAESRCRPPPEASDGTGGGALPRCGILPGQARTGRQPSMCPPTPRGPGPRHPLGPMLAGLLAAVLALLPAPVADAIA
jgi:hypothetical protein